MPIFIFQVIWLRKKKKLKIPVYVNSPHIIFFRVTLSVGHKSVQKCVLFGIFVCKKRIGWLILYQKTVVVGLTRASK